jgi:hypothetical protein
MVARRMAPPIGLAQSRDDDFEQQNESGDPHNCQYGCKDAAHRETFPGGAFVSLSPWSRYLGREANVLVGRARLEIAALVTDLSPAIM